MEQSLVLGLQTELLEKDCDINQALRRAHAIAVKLSLTDMDSWIIDELNGYPEGKDVPPYRQAEGILKAKSFSGIWIPAVSSDEQFNYYFSHLPIRNSIPVISELLTNGDASYAMQVPGQVQRVLSKYFEQETLFKIEISRPQFTKIREQVQNRLLDWTLKLEEQGIIGRGMSFSSSEKENATHFRTATNNYYGNTNIITSPTGTVLAESSTTHIESSDYDKANEIIKQMRKTVSDDEGAIPDATKQNVLEKLDQIDADITNRKQPSLIKESLSVLKDIIVSAIGGAAAAPLLTLIQQIPF